MQTTQDSPAVQPRVGTELRTSWLGRVKSCDLSLADLGTNSNLPANLGNFLTLSETLFLYF